MGSLKGQDQRHQPGAGVVGWSLRFGGWRLAGLGRRRRRRGRRLGRRRFGLNVRRNQGAYQRTYQTDSYVALACPHDLLPDKREITREGLRSRLSRQDEPCKTF
ncbi:MAG: hypothetical protein CL940_11505 [Deltaproteobacteria bacterium]|nr:hypothetical protein [Deltaproteobacteria bacterium]